MTTKTLKSQTSATPPNSKGYRIITHMKHHKIILPLLLLLDNDVGNNDDDCYYLWDTHAKKLALAKVDENSTRELWSKFSIHAASGAQISLCAQGVRKRSPDTTDSMETVAADSAAAAGAAAAAAADSAAYAVAAAAAAASAAAAAAA